MIINSNSPLAARYFLKNLKNSLLISLNIFITCLLDNVLILQGEVMCESLLGFNWLKKYLSIFFVIFWPCMIQFFFQSTLVSWLSKSTTCKCSIDKKTEKLIIVTLQF